MRVEIVIYQRWYLKKINEKFLTTPSIKKYLLFAIINPGKSQSVVLSIVFFNILRLRFFRFDKYNLILI